MPIFDQGYQHWAGTLSGHTWRWLTITRHGVRVGMKNPILRIAVIMSWIPAAVLAFILCLWGLLEHQSPLVEPFVPLLKGLFTEGMVNNPRQFRVEAWTICYDTFLTVELYISMVVVLLVGPGLISLDLRFNALPLYFSRPLRRIDYFAGKLGVIAWFLSLVVIFPAVIAFVFGLLFSLDITIVWDTLPLQIACLAYGAIIVLSAGTLMLALSSLSRNSRYIALFWVVLWLVGSSAGGLLNLVDNEQRNYAQRHQAASYSVQQPRGKPLTVEEQAAQQEALKQAQDEMAAAEEHAAQTNWRPLVSYTANLSRIGKELLRTNSVWRKVSELEPAPYRQAFLQRTLGPQYPWYWSAIVLAIFLGLSVCILNFRIRSLDRLK